MSPIYNIYFVDILYIFQNIYQTCHFLSYYISDSEMQEAPSNLAIGEMWFIRLYVWKVCEHAFAFKDIR